VRSQAQETLGRNHSDTAGVLENLADLLRLQHRDAEAAKLEARARSIHDLHAVHGQGEKQRGGLDR
jgi:hypothetical protein